MSPKPADNPSVMKALKNLFDSLSPDDKQTFLARSSASSSPVPEEIGIDHLSTIQAESDTADEIPSPTQGDITKVTAVKRRQILNNRKAKKPLNAFIAYRCKIFANQMRCDTKLNCTSAYYSPELQNLTQKTKSGMIQKMWAEEPRKPLFTLLGQAYSELRDSDANIGQDKSLLKKFLSATADLLGIIPAEEYLDTMGWVRGVNYDGEEVLERSEAGISVPVVSMTTNYSVQDIVDHCHKIGLVTRPPNAQARAGRNPGGAMAFAAAPRMSDTLRRQLVSAFLSYH